MVEVYFVQPRRGMSGLHRHTFLRVQDVERAVTFAHRIAGRYGVEYVRVEERRWVRHFCWVEEPGSEHWPARGEGKWERR